jgi:hypothetical protein
MALVLATLAASPAGAQTRAEELAKKQEEKAAVVAPPQKNKAERIVERLQGSPILGGVPHGFFPIVQSVYPGGWLAFGPGYRTNFADTGNFTVGGAYSIKNFKMLFAALHLPEMADRRFLIDLDAKWIDAPTVAFYGTGPDSSFDDKTLYGYEPLTVGVTARVRPVKAFTFGAGVNYLDIGTSPADGKTNPSIEALFSPVEAPGLGTDPTYIQSRAFAIVDWRRPPGYSGTGGMYRLEVQNFDDRDDLGVGFRQLEGEVVQLIPILRANWVIALRGLVTITDTDSGDVVPYYLMPSLGGSHFNRGFTSFRFRGNHRLLTSIEYRWTPGRFMDMAIFYDAGKVADDRDDLDFDHLEKGFGVGARFHGASATVLRIELAHSNENNLRFIFVAGAAF